MVSSKWLFLMLSLCALELISAKKHRLTVTEDRRKYIALSTFGFYQGGVLEVKMYNMMLRTKDPHSTNGMYAFTLDRTTNDAIKPYLDYNNECPLQRALSSEYSHHPDIYFKMNLVDLKLEIECGSGIEALHLYDDRSQIDKKLLLDRNTRSVSNESVSNIGPIMSNPVCANKFVKIYKETKKNLHDRVFYNVTFALLMETPQEEGFYNLYFHNCPGYWSHPMYFTVEIYESNAGGNFLSAGDMLLPSLYVKMSLLFALCACVWCYILCTSRHPVYKIHYLMCTLIFLKSLSLALHGVNYYFIQTRGEHVPAWAILYYITHLFKGALLFITIVLVGTGWNFIKHILADRDKKLFMIVIPLQVVANVAEIIIEESEEGAVEYNAWRYIFLLVDLLCCGAILFPVVWSIQHLKDASTTDGKALMNLRKLKLFRHFYIMVVCYIYFTRIIAFLLKKTVPFQYSWLDELFKEMTTYVFFVMTGYKFRPASANPYFATTSDSSKPEVLSDVAVYDGISRLSKVKKNEASSEDREPLMREEYD